MGLLKFLITLDHPVYYAGQIISGKLEVEVDEPMSMRGIYLMYSGKGTVRWTETYRRKGETNTIVYRNLEHYLTLQQLLFGNDAEDCELAEGEHVFLFNCQLPMNLPSSFEGPYGRVRYSVKAIINRPWKFNHVTKQPLTVTSVFDLNLNPFAAAPVTEQASKKFWGHSDQLFMTVNLPVRGYVPGQIIPIKIFLNNETGVQIKSVYVSLKQNLRFHATHKSKTVKEYVFKNEFPVPEGFGREEVPLNLHLPALPPSNLEFCKIIDLDYQLNVTARASGWYHRNLITRIELIVGNIPLMSYQKPIPAHQTLLHEPIDHEDQSEDHQPPAYSFDFPPGMMYEDLPPPTYEQSMGLQKSEKEIPENDPDSDGEVTEFSPLYPIYKFEASQA